MNPMNRREAVKTTAAVVGGVLLTSSGALAGCSRESEPQRATASANGKALSDADQTLIEDVADTLLPTTPRSPGAKAAGAGAFINLVLTDCYEPADQKRVVDGLAAFRRTCDELRGRPFASLSPSEREQVVRAVDAEAQKARDTHYFGLVRELALRSYFSSETGMTKARRYMFEPGKWVGCVPLAPGQPAWA
jgi:hypothetical protein